MPQKRDKHGRFVADHSRRNRRIGAAALGTLAALGAGVVAAWRYHLVNRTPRSDDKPADPEQTADGTPEHPYDFRPDSLVAASNHDGPPAEAAVH
ncbi:hypothetical protein GCM10023219_31340 [Stakelama sediminis]|uniref:Uncharacterized protein n=1 Tax=Stakelama sediminis TaxID=463200 RepID=A0A840Z175_9SPHN|nr:hypothetical protein [Stakelama sediminis]MBB5719675.1 hypothetical protein [Stakelama sediminis]